MSMSILYRCLTAEPLAVFGEHICNMAQDPNTDPNILAAMAKGRSIQLHRLVSSNPSIPADAYQLLIYNCGVHYMNVYGIWVFDVKRCRLRSLP